MSALRWLRDAAMRAGGPVTLAALLVALMAAGGVEAQQACTNTDGTCRPCESSCKTDHLTLIES